MATITKRATKGSPLTNDEVDANFENLNTDKLETSGGSVTGDISFGDNDKAIFGAGSDLQIYHNGSNSYILEQGTGRLFVNTDGAGVSFLKTDGESLLTLDTDGAVTAYYDNSAKLATTNTGIDVTGTVTADGLTVDSDSDGGATIQGGSSRGLVVHRNDGTGSQSAGIQIKNNDREWTFFANDDSLAVFDDTANKTHFKVETGGDISFYEDTGTTAKFFWDASAESLGIGTTSPSGFIHTQGSSTGTETYAKFSTGPLTGDEILTIQSNSSRSHMGLQNKTGGGLVQPLSLNPEGGNVGIGDTNPTTKLALYQTGDVFVGIDNDQAGNKIIIGKQGATAYGATGIGEAAIYTYDNSISIMADGGAGNTASIKFSSGGNTERMRIDSSGTLIHKAAATFNEDGGDSDFRVESESETHMIFVDAAEDAVTMKTSSPSDATLTINGSGSGNYNGLLIRNTATSNLNKGGYVSFGRYGNADESWVGFAGFDNGTDRIAYVGGGGWSSEEATISRLYAADNYGDAAAKVRLTCTASETIINDPSEDHDFRVESDASTHALFVDAGHNVLGVGTANTTDPWSGYGTTIAAGSLLMLGSTGASSTFSDFCHGGYYDGTNWLQRATDVSVARHEMVGPSAGSLHRFYTAANVTADTATTQIENLRLTTADSVFNELSRDLDFRVESDSNTHMLCVDASENTVGVNRSDPEHFLDIYTATSSLASVRCRSDRAAGQNFIHFDYATTRLGSITGNGSVLTYGGTSDYRLKTNVQPLSGNIDRVKRLKPVTFDWIASGVGAEGFIAHELQSVVPSAVTGSHNEVDDEGNPVYQQVDPRNVVPLLTAALQEAIAKIESLEARVAQLEAN